MLPRSAGGISLLDGKFDSFLMSSRQEGLRLSWGLKPSTCMLGSAPAVPQSGTGLEFVTITPGLRLYTL